MILSDEDTWPSSVQFSEISYRVINPLFRQCPAYAFSGRVRPTASGSTPMAAFIDVRVLNIEGRGLPGCVTPPGWRPCILEYRRRNRVKPVLPGVSSTSELHGVLYVYPALTTAIMEWDSKLERMFAGDPVPALHGLFLQYVSMTSLGLTL